MPLLDIAPASAPVASRSPYEVLTVVSLVLLGLTVLWAFSEPRLIDGVPVWLKPAKFLLSFAVLFGTLALIEPRLSTELRGSFRYNAVAAIMAAAFIAEMAYIIYQAARGEASHFNDSTPFHAVMYYTVMATGAVALVASIGVIGWWVRRDTGADLGPALRDGIWIGFALSFVLTMIVAGTMSSGSGHFVGTHPEGAPVIPGLGWSGVTGDLRPAHFLSLHAMQALPLLGLWLDRQNDAPSLAVIWIAGLIYAIATLAVFAQALMGMPLVRLG